VFLGRKQMIERGECSALRAELRREICPRQAGKALEQVQLDGAIRPECGKRSALIGDADAGRNRTSASRRPRGDMSACCARKSSCSSALPRRSWLATTSATASFPSLGDTESNANGLRLMSKEATADP
jgi:hypothetical protein